MSKTVEKTDKARRNFLKLAAISAPAAAATATLGTEAEAAAVTGDETVLRDTAHTRAFYASARF